MNDMAKIVVSKLDAAKRQLDCAIELWFADKDPVSVHTLVGAAYQIIHDTNKKRGGEDLLFDSPVIKDEYRAQAVALLRRDFMFFKHADRDPDEVTDFVPLGSLMFMLMAVETLRKLGERQSDQQIALTTWMSVSKPEWVSDGYRNALVKRVTPAGPADFKRMSKAEWFAMSLRASAELRIRAQRI